jgi:hypothetical protein
LNIEKAIFTSQNNRAVEGIDFDAEKRLPSETREAYENQPNAYGESVDAAV